MPNRRKVLVSGTAVAAAAATGGAAHATAPRQSAVGPRRIAVRDELAPLKEAFVGRMDIDSLVHPLSYSIVEYWGMSQAKIDAWNRGVGRPFRDMLDPAETKAVEHQMESLVSLYEAHGVRVHRPRQLTRYEDEFVTRGHAELYTRDTVVVVGNTAVETTPMMPSRRKEIFGLRETLTARLAADPDAGHVAMPQPPPTVPDHRVPESPGPFLEGGDLFQLGDDILVGNSGLASNSAGVAWLRRQFPDRRVHEVGLRRPWLHLDCVLSIIRPGLVMCYRDGLVDGLPEPIADWEVIDATREEAHALGCNTMALAPNKVVIAREHTRLIRQLRRRRVDVISEFEFGAVCALGGGIRCVTSPLRRG
ncbi:dimethylarginine dimethylaminohydrolase family protein [Streptomyces sp. NPDC048172]|uniref:dimethylarginine dimethylaminohydrolase family protein n=1 Tax=Streptomyces sp. NPDC048172 TaxID=3365505 RepID=UPI0037109139